MDVLGISDGKKCEDICRHAPPSKEMPCVDCDMRCHDRAEPKITHIENVISNLELNIRWICDNQVYQFPGWANVEMAMRDALELLKEQQIVRCKDCKHYMQPDGSEKGDCFIKMGYFPVSEDWFCADGEKRTD